MKGKPVDEVTAARIRRAVREGRVEIAPQDKIAAHRQQIDRILRDPQNDYAINSCILIYLDI
jgi:hypothetical protein